MLNISPKTLARFACCRVFCASCTAYLHIVSVTMSQLTTMVKVLAPPPPPRVRT